VDQYAPSDKPVPSESTPTDRAKARSAPWWRQLVLTLVVIVIAVYAAAYLIPGTPDLLARYGIALPFAPAAASPDAEVAGTSPGQQGQQGQPGQQAQQGQQGANPGRSPGNFRGNRQQPVVVTAAVTSAIINDKLMAIGEGSAARAVTLTSAAGGTLTALKVKPGDWVEANTVIATLDADSEEIAYDRAQLASADATAALARSTELANSNSISNVQLNTAQLAADTAALEVRNAQLALDGRSIKTPIAGTVGLLQVSPGNLVNAQTVVTTIEDSSEILINFWVPERYASSIAVGMPVSAIAVALPGQTFTGTVSAVDNRIDQQSRTLQVQAVLPNDDGRIRAGMSFQITMSFPGDTFAAVDPLSIQWSADGAYVWKYAGGKVQQAFVQIVERNSGGVLVTGDVAVGDQVVTQGVLQLQQGAEVRLLDDPARQRPNSDGQSPQQGQTQQQGTPL
jgi:RND family efflux transporter MFP subunit